MAVVPTAEQFQAFAGASREGEVVMLNLLRFAGESGEGAAEYRRYSEAALKMVTDRGGRLVWMGRPEHVVVGDADDAWDMVAVVAYPSREAFVDMVTSPDYMEAHQHRESGLQRTVLLACEQLAGQ